MLCREGEKTGMNDPVDVLIIGAGASGAAVAWSLAENQMHILARLEQGGWIEPGRIPERGPRLGGAVLGRLLAQPKYPRAARGLSDQRRQLADQGGELQRGRRQHDLLHRAFPAPAIRPIFGVHKSLDGVAGDWPIDYDTLGTVLRRE